MNQNRYVDALSKAAHFDKLHEAYRRMRAERDALALEVAELQHDNRRLRKRLHENSQYARLLRRAKQDAQLMILLHCAQLPISRREMEGNGISERRWARARALLIVARVHDGRELVNRDAELLLKRLEGAYLRCEDDPQVLRARIARH